MLDQIESSEEKFGCRNKNLVYTQICKIERERERVECAVSQVVRCNEPIEKTTKYNKRKVKYVIELQ